MPTTILICGSPADGFEQRAVPSNNRPRRVERPGPFINRRHQSHRLVHPGRGRRAGRRKKPQPLTAGASWQSGSKLEFGPSRSASRRAERFLVAFPTFLGLVHPRQRFAPLTGFGRNRLSLDHGAAPLGERTLGRAGQQPSSCPDYRKEISGNDMFRKVDVSGNE